LFITIGMVIVKQNNTIAGRGLAHNGLGAHHFAGSTARAFGNAGRAFAARNVGRAAATVGAALCVAVTPPKTASPMLVSATPVITIGAARLAQLVGIWLVWPGFPTISDHFRPGNSLFFGADASQIQCSRLPSRARGQEQKYPRPSRWTRRPSCAHREGRVPVTGMSSRATKHDVVASQPSAAEQW
jgi:hypothetical protein